MEEGGGEVERLGDLVFQRLWIDGLCTLTHQGAAGEVGICPHPNPLPRGEGINWSLRVHRSLYDFNVFLMNSNRPPSPLGSRLRGND